MSSIGPDYPVTPPRQPRSLDEIYARNQENMLEKRRRESQSRPFAPIPPISLSASILAAELPNSRPLTAQARVLSSPGNADAVIAQANGVTLSHIAHPKPLAASTRIMAQIRPIDVHVPQEQRINVRVRLLPADADVLEADMHRVTVLVDRPPHAPVAFRNVEALPTENGWAVRVSDSQWAALVEAATLPST